MSLPSAEFLQMTFPYHLGALFIIFTCVPPQPSITRLSYTTQRAIHFVHTPRQALPIIHKAFTAFLHIYLLKFNPHELIDLSFFI